MDNKLNKLSLPATIIIASLILGGFYYASQVSKQRSIERQQEIKIEQEKEEKIKEQEAKTEQENKENLLKVAEYIAKRKMDCYEIFKSEQRRVNNAVDYSYVETCPDPDPDAVGFSELRDLKCENDSCEIIYKDKKTGILFPQYH